MVQGPNKCREDHRLDDRKYMTKLISLPPSDMENSVNLKKRFICSNFFCLFNLLNNEREKMDKCCVQLIKTECKLILYVALSEPGYKKFKH